MEMSDREFIELAAKAYGLAGEWVDFSGMDIRVGYQGGLYVEGVGYWNPLADDGDALRLAVKLRLAIDHNHPSTNQIGNWVAVERQGWEQYPPFSIMIDGFDEKNRSQATSRAITLAAAEIGKRMA